MKTSLWVPIKAISLGIVASLIFNGVTLAGDPAWPPQTPQERSQGTMHAVKVKAEVQKRGVDEKSQVKVRLRSKMEVKGFISGAEETSFAVTDKKTGQITTIPYEDVEKIGGPGLSRGAKIGIAVGAGVVVFCVALGLYIRSRD